MSSKFSISSPDAVNASPPIPILGRLKDETALEHRRLEAHLDLLRPGFTRSDYAALLGRLYGYYKPWEGFVFRLLSRRHPEILFGRQKTTLLMEDLRFLEVQPEVLPCATILPALATTAQALGSFYVIEGSTLGGQILTRHFEASLGFREDGLQFFRGYGTRTGQMWSSFRDTLTDLIPAENADEAVGAAKDTFRTLDDWLTSGDRR